MKLPTLPSFLNRNKVPAAKRYFVAMQIGRSVSRAAIWTYAKEVTIEKTITGISPHEVLTPLLSQFPSSEIIFGLPPEYVEENKIKDAYLPELKRITDEFKLKPVGFVVIPEAIAHYLESEQEIPQTAILLAVEDVRLTFSLFRIGKCKNTVSISRSDNLFADFEKGINVWTDEEILPSKIILYDEGKQLEDVKEQLLTYPWQKNEKFLHVPKIETLPSDFSIEAVVHAGASEMEEVVLTAPAAQETTSQASFVTEEQQEEPISQTAATETTVTDSSDMSTNEQSIHTSDDFGFVQETDIAQMQHPHGESTPVAPKTTEIKQSSPLQQRLKSFKMPTLSLPHALMLPQTKALIPAAAILVALVVFGASLFFWYPKVTIALIAEPKTLQKEVSATLNTSISSIDTANKQIPGKVYTITVTKDTSAETTGTKTIGEKAAGEVQVYNKTTQQKTFPKGTVLSASSDLTFTLMKK